MTLPDVSVILPAMNETFSLDETVRIILDENPADIKEILVVLSPKSTPECVATAHSLATRYPVVKPIVQKRGFVGGAIRDAFEVVSGDYVILMASDLETDPHAVRELIRKEREGYDIVTATRWTGAGFTGYDPVKYVLNKIFQIFFRILYGTRLTDLTYAFRIFKTDIVKRIRWEELRHPFLFETMVKPLRLGYKITEIPAAWSARKEGESQNTFWRNFEYFKIGFKVRFASRASLIND